MCKGGRGLIKQGVGNSKKEKTEIGTAHEKLKEGGGRLIRNEMNDENDKMILDDECLEPEQKRKRKRILPIWMLKETGKKAETSNTEKIACVEAEKIDGPINDPKKINVENNCKKGIKSKDLKVKNKKEKKLVILNCVKVEGHRWVNMPGPKNPTQEKPLTSRLCREKMTSVPNLSSLTADTTITKKSSTIASIDKNETSIPTMPAKEEEITSFDWPEFEEDEELELENQMIQLQIRLERQKKRRRRQEIHERSH